MIDIERCVERLGELLEALDALQLDMDGEDAEALEDLNAELEDTMMLLEGADDEDDELLDDARDELREMVKDYEALAKKNAAIAPLAERLREEAAAIMGE